MARLSQRLSSLLLGLLLLAVPVSAFVPTDPFISELSEARKELIRLGHTAPYNQLTVQRVVVGKARIMPNGAIINLPHGPEFVPTLNQLRYDPKWQVKEQCSGSDLQVMLCLQFYLLVYHRPQYFPQKKRNR